MMCQFTKSLAVLDLRHKLDVEAIVPCQLFQTLVLSLFLARASFSRMPPNPDDTAAPSPEIMTHISESS